MRSDALIQPKSTWLGGLMRVTAAVLSAGAALVSILSYTGASSERAEAATDRAHRLSLTPAADTATSIGDTIQLAALATDDRGAALLGLAPVWTTADPAVAEVDQSGAVVARGRGITAIIVRVGNLEGRARIAVEPRPAVIRLLDTALSVPEGERVPVRAEIADARGNAIPGVPVHWQSADAAVALADSTGQVEGVSPGRSLLTASVEELRAEVPVDVVPVPASITVLGGEGQRATAGKALPAPVTAQVVSRTGRPIPGAVVSFQVRDGEGEAVPTVDTADARGMVGTTWTLGAVPGRRQLAIAVEGVAVSPVVTAEADPAPGNTRVALAGELLPGAAGDSLPAPVTVRVTDSTGVALADLPVAWTTPDGGRIVGLTARTDSFGEARAVWRLGSRAGVQRARVQVGNARSLPALTIESRALPGEADSVVVRGGDRQTGPVGQRLPKPIVLMALDHLGNPVPGIALEAAPTAGALVDSTVRTDSAGRARLQWTLGRTAGSQRLSVALPHGRGRVELSARAAAGAPSKVTFAALPSSVTAGRAVGSGISVEVRDAFGNPVAGQRVTLAATSGTVSPARAVTDEAGRVKADWTPGSKAGKATLTARIGAGDLRATQTTTVAVPRATRRAP